MLHYPVHIKLDTGMHRVGFTEEMLDMLADELKDNNAIAVRSVFSHLATADCTDMDDATNAQLESFDRLSASLEKKSAAPSRAISLTPRACCVSPATDNMKWHASA